MTWIKTYHNNVFSYERSELNEIYVSDIAHALSKEQRFSGHLQESWTVGQHTLLVRKLVELSGGKDKQMFIALHHDSAEAYMKDLPTPLKSLLPDYNQLYKKVENQVAERFDIKLNPLDPLVSKQDHKASYIEDTLFSKKSSKTSWHSFTKEDYLKLNKETHGAVDKYISYLLTLSNDAVASLFLQYHYNPKRL